MTERVCEYCGLFWSGGLGFQADEMDLKFCGRACFKGWKLDMKFAQCELEAIENSLKPLGAYVAESGIMDKPFKDCTKEEILSLTANIVKIFRGELEQAIGKDCPF